MFFRSTRMRTVVVGSGIIGAAIAWQLARTGAQVTIIDAGSAGGLATRHSWAWINAGNGASEAYFRLRLHAMQLWREWQIALPDVPIAWNGSLVWDRTNDELIAFSNRVAALGHTSRLVDRRDIQQLEPQLAAMPELALHFDQDGAVEPLAATETLLRAAADHGAVFIDNHPVRSVETKNSCITGVRTDSGSIAADVVVVAAGTATNSLLATVGITIPLASSPSLLLTTAPHSKILHGMVMSPDAYVRQAADGRLLACTDDIAADLLTAMKGMLLGSDELRIESHAIGYRPIPGDGLPAVGPVDGVHGLYAAVMHSGITLAPAIGQLLAEEITHGHRNEQLTPFGLERFLSKPAC